ncbi:HNH endonuclease [Microcystis sp. M061S2]|uniref:HNH endonuclease n=1 Tax=Microcystis sp. M061S2 TaxID=2771171 RepID=UPI00258914DF|nr:HNH endonuclease [Microcystis sp. M061S2]MCA2653765.1 HNH endonuclease [Microcystis sp. M061S2]
MARNYKSEYKNYQGSPEQIARRSSRNKARRAALKAGVVTKGSSADIGHKNGNPLDNRPSNLEAVPKSVNRSYPRTKTARKRNPKD